MRVFGRCRNWLGPLLIAASPLAAAASGQSAGAPCLAVHGDSILAGDLAAVNPVFGALDASLAISSAPMPGAQRVFRAVELARLVRVNRLPAGPLREVCFEWPTEVLAPEKLAQAMAGVLNCEASAVEVIEQSRFPAPPGDLVFAKRDLDPMPGSDGRLLVWRGFVRYSGDRRFPVWARVRILAPATRVIARAVLAPGEQIREEQIETTVIKDGIAGGIYASALADVVGRVPRTRIEAGSPIRLFDVSSPPEVQAGNEVQVEVRNGAMRIRMIAKAERSGRIGDTIPLTNPDSSAHFRARVGGKDLVVVTVERRQGEKHAKSE